MPLTLTNSRARVLSNVSISIAQVFFAASVGALTLPIDADRVGVVLSYLILSILFWILALVFGQKGKI